MKNKKIIITLSIIAILVLTIGVTYSIFSLSKVSKNSSLVVGDIYMHYTETTAGINIENMVPSNTYDNTYFEFTVDGKNTHTKYGINYNIELVHGNDETDKVRIEDKFLKFRLVEVKDNQEEILKDDLIIENINNTSIYNSTIPANTTNEIVHTYRLYMGINKNVNVCGGDKTDCDYTITEWSKLFASIKVNVNGKYVETTNFVEAIKNRYNGSNQDGLVAVNADGDLATTDGTIREYRYSGIGNYCTYTDGTNDYNLSVSGSTCPTNACLANGAIINGNSEGLVIWGSCADNNGTTINIKNNQTTPTDSGLRNYVKFNNETWRIVGIFNEENASGEKAERIKLVKDEPISASTEAPATITKDSITYQIYNTDYTTYKYKYFYWNKPSSVETNYDDWTKSGSMYYLNENYLNSLENSTIIENMKYYLGNVNTDNGPITGTAKEVYTQERGTTVCDSSITSYSHKNNCNIWYGNQATWNGKIALLYPSDYGYASNTSNWSKDLSSADSNDISLSNWMFNNEAAASWFLSPASFNPHSVALVSYGGILHGDDADFGDGLALRPVLSLGSQTMISSGTGSMTDPYIISAE